MPKFQVRLGYVGHETYIYKKKLVWVVSNYINMLGCVDANLTNFFSVLNFAHLSECGVKKPLSMMMKLKHILHVLFTKASQISLVATFYVCIFNNEQLSSMFHSTNQSSFASLCILILEDE